MFPEQFCSAVFAVGNATITALDTARSSKYCVFSIRHIRWLLFLMYYWWVFMSSPGFCILAPAQQLPEYPLWNKNSLFADITGIFQRKPSTLVPSNANQHHSAPSTTAPALILPSSNSATRKSSSRRFRGACVVVDVSSESSDDEGEDDIEASDPHGTVRQAMNARGTNRSSAVAWIHFIHSLRYYSFLLMSTILQGSVEGNY